MKKTFTILIAAIAAILMMAQPVKVMGQTRTAAYVLDFTTINSSHQGYGDIWTYNNATSGDAQNWSMSKGQNNNGQWAYVKFGGKGGSTSSATTPITSYTQSTFAINSDVDLITVNIDGIDANYTFTSMKLQVSSSSSFNGDLVDEITVNSISNSTVEFEPSEDDYWESGSYYKILITGTAKGKNNVGIKITTIVFQEYESGGSTPVDPTITFIDGSVNVGKTLDLSTLFTSNSSGAVNYSITTGGSNATLSGSTLTGVAEGNVTVKASQAAAGSYNAGEATATITVNAAPTLSSITITTPPTKTTYTEGETFDATGMVVTATYSDASTEDVTALCSWTPNGALTTSDTEITVSYTEGVVTKTATQAITVNEYVQLIQFNIALNNTAFGCSTGNNGEEQSLTINRTVVVAGCASNAQNKTYYDTNHVRFYANSYLRITAPTGYNITKTVFTADGTWNGSISTNEGTYTNDTKTWEGSTSQLDFSFAAQNRISSIAITLAVPGVEYSITYDTGLTNGAFAAGNPTSVSAGSTVTVATTPDAGYHLATMTYNDGTNTESATVSGNSGSFTMPEHNVTVSATFAENVATFTDGVYSEPMTTQNSFNNMTAISVTGDDWVWHYDAGAYINGYSSGSNHANVDWLITPRMEVVNGKLDISFDYWHNFQNNQLAVKWSTSNDLSGTWNDLTFTEGSQNTWHNDNTFIIQTDAQYVYVAFVYTGTDSASGAYRVRNFTAKQYYTITVGNPDHGSIMADPDDIAVVGSEVEAIAVANPDYHFVSWNITPSSVTIENDKFTMPAENVTLSATFEADITYTITYYENGVTNTDGVLSGPIGNNLHSSPASDDPANLEFVGWSTSQISKYTTTQPELVDATYNVTGDVTFYAVYKYDYSYNEGGGTPTWTKVTDASTLAAGDQLVIASDTKNVVATEAITYTNNSNYMSVTGEDGLFESGIMNSLPTGAAVLTLGGEEDAWTLANSSYQLLGATAEKKLAWGSGTTTWSISISDGAATIQNGTSLYGRFLHNVNSTRFTTYTSAPNVSMLLPQLYRLEGGSTTVSGTYYLTSVTEIATETTIAANKTTTLTNNVTVNSTTGSYVVNGILDGAGYIIINEQTGGLVVNNGGQLICDNAVTATVNKDVAAAGNWLTESSGWNFIASPLTSAYTLSGSSMVSGTYDLYRLNNTNWENYKNSAHSDFTTLNNETGYLYANNTAVTLSFAGTVKPYDADLNIPVTEGWNLVGNPYTFDAYANVAYYAMNEAGTGITATTVATSTAAKPCTGIIIYAEENGNVKFLNSAPSGSANNGNLQMVLAHNVATRDGASVNKTIDNAIVSFNEGTKLQKFYFGEPAANIFIPQNGEDYAIAFSNRQGDMPLNFKTTEAGMYTISFEGDNMDLKGVSLIDMLAEEKIDLSVDPSYTFIGSPADKAERFKIVFSPSTGSGADIFAYQSGSDIIVSGEGELQIFDVMGRKVKTQYVSGVQTVNVNAQGVYIMKLNEKTQKIIVR